MKTVILLITTTLAVGCLLSGCANDGAGSQSSISSPSTGATNAIGGPGSVGTSEVGGTTGVGGTAGGGVGQPGR